MSKGLRVIKENNNLAKWSRQVEECRSSGLSVRAWCEQTGIAVSTFHYRQQKVWEALQRLYIPPREHHLHGVLAPPSRGFSTTLYGTEHHPL